MPKSSVKDVMPHDVLIRPADESDTGQILELLKLSLGEGSIPRDERYWSWKHEQNPFGLSPALVAEEAGQLVGLRVFMRWRWVKGFNELDAVRAVDTATHPDWQGRRIFTRLTLELVERMQTEGISFVFNTPNRFSRPGYLKMGWSSVGRASLWVLPSRPLNLIRVLVTRDGRPAGSESAVMLDGNYRVEEHLARPELDRLLESHDSDSRLATSISRAYLRWRYVDIPDFAYHAIGNWTEGEEALIIFRVRPRRGLTELRLCEVLSGFGRRSVRRASALIRDVVRAVRPDFTVAMAASRTPERRALIRAGFLPAPRLGPILTVLPLAVTDTTEFFSWSGWRTSIGDLELF